MRYHYFIIIAIILISYSKKLQVHCQGRELEIPFNVNENQAEVEQLIFDNASKKCLHSFFEKFRFLNEKNDPNSVIIPVCDLQFRTQLAMCKAILDMYYFGFTFHYELAGYTCHVQTISFKQPLCDEKMTTCWSKKNKPCKKSLFQCPRLAFNDLETDERIVVPLNHYISGSHLPNSYLSYLEEDGAIYPQKYAYNVSVEKIGTELGDKYRGSIKSESDRLIRESLFLAIKNMKESGKTYEKFVKTFKCRSICGLNRASKISLCREISQAAHSESIKIYRQGYDETVCLRRMVFYAEGINYPASHKFTMAILKCPPLYRLEDNKTMFSSHMEYLSMGLEPRSIMWYHRRNLKGMEIRLEAIIYKTRYDTFEEDERRKREFMEPGYILKLLGGIIGDPAPALSTLSPEDGPSRMILHRHIVEDSTLDFMKVVLMRKPYERFNITYGITDVFGMKVDKFSKICHLILKQEQLGFSFHSTKSNFPRKTQDNNIRLIMRDAESLPGEKLRVRQCPPVSDLLFKHYATSSTRKNELLIYQKYGPDEHVIPIAFVRGINMIDIFLQ